MADEIASLARRVEALENRQRTQADTLAKISLDLAVLNTRFETKFDSLERGVSGIQDGMRWLVRLIGALLITAMMVFLVTGGFSV